MRNRWPSIEEAPGVRKARMFIALLCYMRVTQREYGPFPSKKARCTICCLISHDRIRWPSIEEVEVAVERGGRVIPLLCDMRVTLRKYRRLSSKEENAPFSVPHELLKNISATAWYTLKLSQFLIRKRLTNYEIGHENSLTKYGGGPGGGRTGRTRDSAALWYACHAERVPSSSL